MAAPLFLFADNINILDRARIGICPSVRTRTSYRGTLLGRPVTRVKKRLFRRCSTAQPPSLIRQAVFSCQQVPERGARI